MENKEIKTEETKDTERSFDSKELWEVMLALLMFALPFANNNSEIVALKERVAYLEGKVSMIGGRER